MRTITAFLFLALLAGCAGEQGGQNGVAPDETADPGDAKLTTADSEREAPEREPGITPPPVDEQIPEKAGSDRVELVDERSADLSDDPIVDDAGDPAADESDDGGDMDPKLDRHAALFDPSRAIETAPEVFRVCFETTKGNFVVEVNRAWAPRGADRFYNLVTIGYFDDVALFRAIEGFVVQFGINGEPEVNEKWSEATIPDDPVALSNTRGTMTFATAGPDSRTTQVFINYADRNARLDSMGFSPFGRVVEGMDVVDSFYMGYGDGPPRGSGPDQEKLQELGNAYLREHFPKMDFIERAYVEE